TLSEPAGVHHAEVTNRKVELDRIVGIDRAQPGGNVYRHSPTGTLEPGQLQALTDTNDMRVQRHDQLSGPDLFPHAKIHAILADHPAQKQVQPLAGAAR